jgi:hypothetical protein
MIENTKHIYQCWYRALWVSGTIDNELQYTTQGYYSEFNTPYEAAISCHGKFPAFLNELRRTVLSIYKLTRKIVPESHELIHIKELSLKEFKQLERKFS